ncbi:hypothetical protein TNCV_2436911, partial [Trichonephila clavipes]
KIRPEQESDLCSPRFISALKSLFSPKMTILKSRGGSITRPSALIIGSGTKVFTRRSYSLASYLVRNSQSLSLVLESTRARLLDRYLVTLSVNPPLLFKIILSQSCKASDS